MKLLIDQNLSFTLASSLADLFPGSTHVQQLRLAASRDPDLWALARARAEITAFETDGERILRVR